MPGRLVDGAQSVLDPGHAQVEGLEALAACIPHLVDELSHQGAGRVLDGFETFLEALHHHPMGGGHHGLDAGIEVQGEACIGFEPALVFPGRAGTTG